MTTIVDAVLTEVVVDSTVVDVIVEAIGTGLAGPPGTPAMTPGGTDGQVLTKQSATDYDVAWENPPGFGTTFVETVVAGTLIDVDATDPANPIVSVESTVATDAEVAAAVAAEADIRAAADTALDTRVDALELAPPAHAASHADGGSDEISLAGEQITTGTVADARIAATIARDTEVTAAVAASEAGQVRDGDTAGGVLAGTYPNPTFAVDMATQAELDAHTGDTTDAHDASAISVVPFGSIAATDVQAALAEIVAEAAGTVAVEDEGSAIVASASTLNFVGEGVTATDAGGGQVDVTVPGSFSRFGFSTWMWNTTTTAPPGNTQIRANNADQTAATLLWIDYDTVNGEDLKTILLQTIFDGDNIYVQDQDDSSKWQRYEVTADPTDQTTYTEIAVTWIEGGSALTAQRVLVGRFRPPGGSGVSVLDDLTDVDAPTPGDGQVLTWDAANSEWIAEDPPGGTGVDGYVIIDQASVEVTSGNITLDQTAVTALTAFDLTLTAADGDIVVVEPTMKVGSTPQSVAFDVYSMVSGSPVAPWGAGLSASLASTLGVTAWVAGTESVATGITGAVRRAVDASDLSAGTVTLRLFYAKINSTARTLFAATDTPAVFQATVLRQAPIGGSGSGVGSVVAGHGIDVDNTDPDNPIVAVDETELDALLTVRESGDEFTRRAVRFIEGSNVTLGIVDDAGNDEVEVTIAASGGGGSSDAAWTPVRLATAFALVPTGTYSGGGQTITGSTNAVLSVDGTTVVVGDRLLIKNQADLGDNGLYECTQQGNGSSQPYILTRTADANASGDFYSQKTVRVFDGDRYEDTEWFLDVDTATITLDTTDLTFTQTPEANSYKKAVRLATAAVLSPAALYVAGAWTALSNGALSVDGVAVAVGDRVLVKDQTGSESSHGIIRISAAGSGGTPWRAVRTADADESADWQAGMAVRVSEGTVNADTEWFLDIAGAVTLDTTALTFTQSNGPEVMAAADLYLFANYS